MSAFGAVLQPFFVTVIGDFTSLTVKHRQLTHDRWSYIQLLASRRTLYFADLYRAWAADVLPAYSHALGYNPTWRAWGCHNSQRVMIGSFSIILFQFLSPAASGQRRKPERDHENFEFILARLTTDFLGTHF